MRHLLKSMGVAACLGAAGTDGHAQAAAEVQNVVVTARHYENGVGTSDAASQGTVLGERLTDLPLLRPGEVLETIPGLVVTQHSGDGKANQYFLRGYNLDHGTDFASFVDGVPVNMPTNAHGQGYTDLNFLIPELVDRIDYRKGPYFAQSGDFSSAGSAQIRYVDHLDGGLLNLTSGSDRYRRLLLAGSPTLLGANAPGGPRLLGAVEMVGDDGPWTTPERMRRYNGVLRLADGSRDRGWSMDAMAMRARWTSTDQVPLALIQDGTLGRYSALDPTDGGRSERAVLSGEWHSRDADGYTSASAFVAHNELTLWSNFTYFEEEDLGGVPVNGSSADPHDGSRGDQFKQQESRNYLGGQLVHGWAHGLFGHDSTTEVGLQLRHDHDDVGLYDTQARRVFATVSDDHVDETETGLYAQNATEWSPWFRSLVGVRFDDVRMRVHALATPANSGSATGNKVSPKASLIFGPWARTEFFANAGRGFHSNDARGVTARVDPTTGGAAQGVSTLAGSKGEELGLRTEVIPGLQTSLAFWRLDSDSELVYSADSGTTDANGASKRHGIELNNHLVLGRWLLVDADMAWTHARFADANANGDTGNHIPNAVSHVGLLGLTLHDVGPWSAGLVTRFIGSYPLSQDDALKLPSSIVSNLQVKRRLTSRVTVALDVLNVFNRRFYDIGYAQDYRLQGQPTVPAGAAPSPGSPPGETVHPGEPRDFRVSLNIRL